MTEPVDQLRADLADFHATLAETLDKQDARLAAADKSRRRQRLGLIVAGVGLTLDLALSGLFIYQHDVQNCQNDLASKQFHVEFAKVSGQIQGLAAVKRGDVVHGLDQFIAASQRYLDQIAQFNKDHC